MQTGSFSSVFQVYVKSRAITQSFFLTFLFTQSTFGNDPAFGNANSDIRFSVIPSSEYFEFIGTVWVVKFQLDGGRWSMRGSLLPSLFSPSLAVISVFTSH